MVTPDLPINEVAVDLEDGGRWTSLSLGGREWFWSGPGLHTGPRDGLESYVDVGGLDECFPTVRGVPDHGGLWNQPWSSLEEDEDWDAVHYEDAVLLRRFNGGDVPAEAETHTIWTDYRLIAPPGYRFLWAAHALLDCAVGAFVDAPAGTVCRLYPEAAGLVDFPPGAPWVEGLWPTPAGLELSSYDPSDGTAVGAVLVDCPTAAVVDGPLELSFALDCPGQPTTVALWRNLGGFPAGDPYRSLGVEPMLGRVFDLAEAGPDDAAVVPESGVLTWRLVVSARSV
ncbi:hypothetical protein GCM10009789_63910 [Kribbella sancticallisti]|uniref:Galactose mutarotase n=1 Tax=Kribbella sancticallisti TaxID=460087 RepID=A0ABP4Q626_9ACTN